MESPTDKRDSEIYQFASLDRYGFRKRLLIRLIDVGLFAIISLIGRTIRFDPIIGWKGLEREGFETFEIAFERQEAGIIAFWHDRIFLSTYFWKDYKAAVMVSRSFDGEYISRTAQRFGYGVIRGSSSRGGTSALAKMIRLTKEGVRMAFTVDGPRGPRYRAKKGVIKLASETGLPIGPMLVEAKRAWRLNSWDRTQIPKPFTRAVVLMGEPVFVPRGADNATIEAKRDELEQKLDELVKRGEEWRDTV